MTIPDRTDAQIGKAKTKCRIPAEKYAKYEWVLDDESYFTLGHSSILGNDKFYTKNVNETPASVKFKKSKCPPKLLVWVAASKKGLSDIYIVPSGLAINSDRYVDEYLSKQLIRFDVFWPIWLHHIIPK